MTTPQKISTHRDIKRSQITLKLSHLILAVQLLLALVVSGSSFAANDVLITSWWYNAGQLGPTQQAGGTPNPTYVTASSDTSFGPGIAGSATNFNPSPHIRIVGADQADFVSAKANGDYVTHNFTTAAFTEQVTLNKTSFWWETNAIADGLTPYEHALEMSTDPTFATSTLLFSGEVADFSTGGTHDVPVVSTQLQSNTTYYFRHYIYNVTSATGEVFFDDQSYYVDTVANQPPVAADDPASTTVDTLVNVAVLGNDSDPDTNPLTITHVGGFAISVGGGGVLLLDGTVVSLLANGTLDITPPALSVAPVTIPYTISDGSGGTATANVNLTIAPLGDLDDDGITDDIDLDDDNDGIPDTVEQATAINGGDTDGDGIPDERDLDADGDGISDLRESGLSPAQILTLDTNNDGVIDTAVGDNGLSDALETDDTPAAQLTDAPVDTDSDGKPDFQDLDSDNDGLHDLVEGSGQDPTVVDTNNDGVLDNNSTDTDGDGIPDNMDTTAGFGSTGTIPADTDGDSVPDYRDLDSDNDGVHDLTESGVVDPAVVDTNNDGVIDNATTDADGDGIPDIADNDDATYGDPQATTETNTDGDSVPDYRDLDSDNDSINDIIEAGLAAADINNDGIADDPTADADGDGVPNSVDDSNLDYGDPDPAALPDADGDGTPDFQEVDSDNDGTNDIAVTPEAFLDADGDGMIDNPADADGDGIPDVDDPAPNTFGTGLDAHEGNLETAVTGNGAGFGLVGLLALMMLLLVRKQQRILKLVSVVLLGLFAMTSVQADTNYCGKSNPFDSDDRENFVKCLYIGLGPDITHVDPEGEAGGFYTPSGTGDDESSGFTGLIGYHFRPRWFGELSYADMGEAGVVNRQQGIASETISYDVWALHVGRLLRAPENRLNFYLKGGVSAISNEASNVNVPFEKQTSAQLSFGLGMQWRAQNNGLFARIGADFYDRDAIAAGIKIGYNFGGRTERQPEPEVKAAEPAPVVVAPAQVPALVVAVEAPAVCESSVLDGVTFHTASARLTESAKTYLSSIGSDINSHACSITIVGHTDSRGSSAYNMQLSTNRARSVAAYLASQGVDKQRLKFTGMGEDQPRASNETSEGRALNRRVELVLK